MQRICWDNLQVKVWGVPRVVLEMGLSAGAEWRFCDQSTHFKKQVPVISFDLFRFLLGDKLDGFVAFK